ncbi:phage tail protein [Acinetobacter sp. V117_2]|uniref:TipJ family phage tail tip protein n=1 Tax=Acinetobacter sp. V117_2 TaxID=3072989 RepID=UPI00287D9A4C|nr:phage tail protein [Acinetobacter sp. V117_2]MDS7966571.1 phage tail protein [Acinetobacter sp. V117_2]
MSIVKGSKKASGQARQPNIAPDSAQSKTRINILYGLAEGEIEGLANGNKSILLENTPLEDNNGKLNFENVKVDFRSGTNDQDYIEGFPAVENETAVDVELKADTPWVKSFKNLDLDALRIRFKWGPLRSQDAKSGDVSGVTIEYAVDVQTDGGPWIEVLKTKISDKTSANYERAHRINLPKADSDWLVRVRRLTPNSTSEYISDKMYIEAVTEVIDAKLRYPNTALLGLQYDAETFNNVAKIAVECKGTKIKLPSNYNPVSRKYTGMWDGTFISAYSNNPAWIYYDICTSDRYGLGDRLTPFMIDKWSLYRLGQYCDEFVNDGQGEQEPRFTCNVYLQRAEEAYEILKKLAGVFRAISYWDGNSIICDADIPQDTYFTYTRANVIGEFEYSGTRARDRHNVVKVAFDNPANHYKTEYEYVRDEQAISDSGQIRVLDLNAWGCTSRGQAQRAGLWALKSEQSETRTVTFKVGLDGWIPQPGRVIEIADELFAGRANGGRVSAISEDRFNLTIDRDDVVAKPGDRLVVNGEDGKAQTRVIQSINGRVITVTLPFDLGSIAAENIWVIDAQDLATMKFRVISIRQEEKNKFTINAIQYNPKKFDEIDNGAHFEEVPISIINPSLQDPVSDISITSEDKVNQGINITTMILSWKQARGAVKYLVEWRKDNGSWLRLPLTGNNSVEVQGVYSGNYQARVTAISAFEVSSLPIYSSITELVGKKGLPPKLEFIRATGILFGMQLDWSFPNTGAQDAAYVEIRVSPDGASNILPLGQFAYPTNTHKVQGLQPNLIQYYSGRIVDKIGNVGPWSEWVNGTTSADPDAVLDLISGHIDESDLAKELQGKIEDTANVAKTAGQAAANAQAAATAANNAADQASAKAVSAESLASQAAGLANNSATMAVNAQNLASKTAGDLKNATDQLNKSISDEANARVTAVSQLNDGLTTETAQRKSEDASLLSNIETYKASTNGTLSSLQEQVTTNATNTGANASKITSLDSRLTTNEGKTGDAINAAATAQQTANTAVDQASAAANSVTALKSDFSGGKGKNAIIAPYSDPQVLAFDVATSAATCALAASTMRVKGKAYDITFTTANGAVYFGTTSAAYAVNRAAATVRGSKKYLLSMYTKSQDASKIVDFYVTVRWFRRLADNSIVTTDVSLSSQASGTTRITPTTAGQVITCKSVTAPSDAFAMSFWITGNNQVNVAGSRVIIDMFMLEESIGDDKSASMWVAGAPDLGAIQSSLDANATAITNLTTRVANDEGTITSHSQSITQLNNSITTINNSLSSKADASALTALDNRVTKNEGNITSQSGQITALNNNVTTINGALTTKADNNALQSLDSKVTNIGGKTDLNTSSITSLNSALNSATSSINMSGANAITDWVLVDGTTTEYKIVSEPTALSGKVLQLGDNAGNDQFWGRANNLIRIDENKTYRLRARYRRKTGAGLIYLGVAQLTVDKSSYVTDTNVVTNSMSSSNYTIAGQAPTLGEWQEVACYLKGRSTGVASGAATINDPRSFAKQAYFISPVFIGNYNNTAGIIELDYLILEDAEAIAGNITNGNAINTLNTNVSNIDGKVTTNTNSITSLNSRMSTAEGGIAGANSAINTLSTRISDAEGKLTSQSNSVTQLSDQIGNTKSYSIVTFRNGSAVGIPRDGGIHSYKGKINGFGRGLNLIVFKNGDVSSVQAFDTYGDMATACTNLNNTIQALASGTYFAIVGTDNIGSVSIHATADTLRTTLLACGASRSYLNTWVGNSLPIFVGRKDLDAGNGIQAMFDSSVMNQWIEYPLTFIDGVPTGMGDSRAITSLLDANASAISSLSNKVTQQGNDITSQSNAITSLNNNLAVSGKAGANLLIKSNVAGTYNGVGYPHVTYEMGEEWEVGAKYTLLWCAEHKRGAGDTNSSLWAYAGGGMQSVQGIENTNGKVINKVTFTKDGVATSKYIHFFMINHPTADKNSIGTVYWAVLVKGDLITTDSWIPSSYDFIVDSRVNSSALNSLDSKVTNIDGRVTSNSNAITSLGSRIATAEGNIASNANAIANTYTKAQADEATAGQINSFNSSLIIGGRNLVRNTGGVREGWAWLFIESLVEPLVGTYTVSFDIENLDGNITGSGIGFRNPNGDFHYFWYPDSTTGHKSVTMNLDSTGFVHFGIWFNNTVRLKNVKVEKGVKDTGWSPAPEDVKAGIDANASAISSLDAKVTQQGNSITSNSNSITSLSNTITTNDLTNWVRNANFADPRNDWSSGTIVDATNAAPNPPSPKALALNNRDNYYGPMFRCNAGDMYYVSAWFASPVASGVNSTLGFHYLDTAGNHGWVGVVYTSEAKRRSWTMLEGYFTVPEGMAQLHPWLQVATGDTAPNEKWHVTNIQVRNITGNKKLVSDLQANSTALNNLSSRVSTTEGNIASQSSSITSLTNQIGNTKSFSLVTFKNGAGAGLPKPAGIYSYKGRVGDFGRGLNLIVFNNGDVVSCTAYDTYGDIVGNCNALYYAVNALASGTYFAIVGTDNIRDVGVLNPDTPLRALMLACGAGDKYFRSWNWTSLPIFVGRKDLDAGNGILGMFDASPQNQWIEYPLVFVSGAPQGMGDSRAITAQLDANAAAISSLSNTVTQQGNDITTQSNAITSLSASVSGIYKDIKLTDTRNDNQPPTWYWQNHGLKIVREFKLTSVLGLSGIMPDTYVTLETQVSWTDPSGGPIIQIARGSSSAFTAERRSADNNSWYPWSQDIKGLNAGLANKADASALSTLDSKVSVIDGKVSTQASSITTLQTSVGNNSASIQSQQQSIDGLRARATLKLQSGNLVGGVGIENDSRTVDFIVQANKFAIGAPSNVDAGSVTPKYAFVYQSTPTTLPNGTVIPAGLYLDNASIGYINADKINATSLSAISANLGTLTTLKDSAKPNGARMVLTGSLITVYDDNNVLRVKLGLW